MKYVKFAMMLAGVAATALSIYYKLPALGGQGIFVLALCALPVVLGLVGTVVSPGMPRWASIVSVISFVIVGIKTREGDELQNIMMLAFAGLVLALALAVKPDKPRVRSAA